MYHSAVAMKPTHPELLTAVAVVIWFVMVMAVLAFGEWAWAHRHLHLASLFTFGSFCAVSVIARRYFEARARRRGERWPRVQ